MALGRRMTKQERTNVRAVRACYEAQAKLDPYAVQNLRHDHQAIYECALKKTGTAYQTDNAFALNRVVMKVIAASRAKRWNYNAAERRERRRAAIRRGRG